jgi:phospholipid N-methyltransferase
LQHVVVSALNLMAMALQIRQHQELMEAVLERLRAASMMVQVSVVRL